MELNNNYQQNMNRQPQMLHNPGQTLAAVSMFMGMACIFTLFTIYLPMILGSLSILFALLSKGYGKKMTATAKIGITTAAVSLALVVTITGSLVVLLFSLSGHEMIRLGGQMDQMFEQQTGISPEDIQETTYEDMMRIYAEMLGK